MLVYQMIVLSQLEIKYLLPASCLSELIQKIRAMYKATVPQIEISILSHDVLQAEVELAADCPNARKHLEQQVIFM